MGSSAGPYRTEGDTMPTTLQDPTRQRNPLSLHAFPDLVAEPTLRARPTLAEELLDASHRADDREDRTRPRSTRRVLPRDRASG